MDSIVVEGNISFFRNNPTTFRCVCCPDQPAHIFMRVVEWEGEKYPQFNAMETAVRKFLEVNANEGRRLRVTVELVDEADQNKGSGNG